VIMDPGVLADSRWGKIPNSYWVRLLWNDARNLETKVQRGIRIRY